MPPPARYYPGRKARPLWRSVFPLAGFAVTFYVIWMLYSHPMSNDKAAKRQEAAQDAQVAQLVEQKQCYSEEHADYYGEKGLHVEVLDSMDSCCAACMGNAACNVFVFCAAEGGCGDQPRGTCWLKAAADLDLAHPAGSRNAAVGWSSGVVTTPRRREDALAAAAARERTESDRLAALRANASLPLVFLDVDIKGTRAGRIEAVLYPDVAPRAAENFRALCTGEKGIVPEGREGAGKPYHFKGAAFYRIIDQFIDQSGINTESVFGGAFRDDRGGLELRHDRKGLLSMANAGPDTNTAHFSIMMGPAPHLNGHYTIFGQVVSGLDVVDAINALAKGKPENTANEAEGVVIVDAGELRRGEIVPNLDQD